MTKHSFRKHASLLAIASCFGVSPMLAEAAGLGRISVQSALGQPLRAEIELNASRDELSGMIAKVAAPDAFRLAGIEYASTLSSIKFVIDKRPNGQSIIRVTTDRPLSDPFVDMLIELTWPSGRLVREYTFLLDPPEMAAKLSPAPVVQAPAVTRVDKVEPKSVPAPAVSVAPAPVAAPAEPAKPAKAPKAEAAVADPAASQISVKRGDTLRKIATDVQAEGVSLDQMLVGLFRANKDAFESGNMNRLKAGKILNVPARDEVAAIPQKDAHKEIVAQAADWNAYRRKLAGVAAQGPASDGAGKQEAGGRITAKVETKAAAASEAKDQVKVSKTETPPVAATGKKSGEEDKVAKERALKDAQEKAAALEKNVSDLQKLVELKNQNLAEVKKQAEASKATAAKPTEPAKPAASLAATSATAAAPAAASAVTAAAAPAAPVAASPAAVSPVAVAPIAASATAAKAEEPAKPAAAPKPKPKMPPPPPPEPTFMEEFGGMLLGLGGALAAAIGGFVFWKRRKKSVEESPSLAVNSLSHPSLGANSVFRATGGQSVDTSNVTPATTDFSQAGPGMIDTDEVDPVAEAEVYMAYGRDAQAEEILLEAMQKDSKRLAIHLKLLEIYSNRKDVKQFETLASELYGHTNGVGVDWEKAAAMGLRIDPTNPLYSQGASGGATFDSESTMVAASPDVLRSTVTMPGALAQMAGAVEVPEPEAGSVAPTLGSGLDFDLGGSPAGETAAPIEAAAEPEERISFDFDLGGGEAAPANDTANVDKDAASDGGDRFTPDGTIIQEATSLPAVDEAPAVMDFKLPDIELGAPNPSSPAVVSAEVAPEEAGGLDFDLGFGDVETKAATPVADEEVIDLGAADAPGMDFDVRLTDSLIEPSAKNASLSSISLDLDVPESEAASSDFATTMLTAPAADVPAEGDDSAAQEVATKLDLAKAYEEMGDHEGARELLQEVMSEGNAAQQEAAKAMLAKLG